MKILHISTYDGGGAGKACLRLHRALLDKGIDSSVLLLEQTATSKDIPGVHTYDRADFSKKIGIRLSGVHQRQMKLHRLLKQGAVDFEYFSFARSIFDVTHSPEFAKADVINLHWVADYLDFPTFFKKAAGKKIVWTLHDMNPFTGGCHYAGTCRGYTTDCPACPQVHNILSPDTAHRTWKDKKSVLQARQPDLHVVTPSSWLGRCSQQSTLFATFPHHVIPNCLDTEVFKPMDRAMCREKLGLPTGKKVLLFVADKLKNKRKGFDLLLQTLNSNQGQWLPDDLVLCSVGNAPDTSALKISIPHISLGMIRDEHRMAMAYNAADVFVLPSREDNLPNVALEAVACGTPVAGFDIGGMIDIVKPGMNGTLAPIFSLQSAISKAFCDSFDREAIRQDALNRYHPSVQAEQYIKVYSS